MLQNFDLMAIFSDSDSKFVDKTGIVGEAETFLKNTRKKNLMQSIEIAKDSEKDKEMERLIEGELRILKSVGPKYQIFVKHLVVYQKVKTN